MGLFGQWGGAGGPGWSKGVVMEQAARGAFAGRQLDEALVSRPRHSHVFSFNRASLVQAPENSAISVHAPAAYVSQYCCRPAYPEPTVNAITNLSLRALSPIS